jgi:anti-sigma B factor antagonist
MELDTGAKEVLDHYYPSTLESVDLAEGEILNAAAEAGFDEDEFHPIGMAVRECMVNAVVHGNRYNRNKQVHVSVTVEPESARFLIRITDQGDGFEMHDVPDPLHDTNLLRHSGRGLFLMGAFMDDMKVRKLSPTGTEVTLIKNIGSQALQSLTTKNWGGKRKVSVKLNTRQVGDVTVIDVSGRITLGEGSSALRDVLRELVAKGNKKILLNLGDVSYIDSSGIGELVSGFTTVANQGGTLKLLSLTKRVKDLLQITKLYTVFDVHEDEAHAVRSFV